MTLFLTYNRLAYSIKSFESLLESDCGHIIAIDNNSTDGTKEWLDSKRDSRVTVILNKTNLGIAGAMNQFLALTKHCEFVGKVDCDTLVPKNWYVRLILTLIKFDLDVLQPKHKIIPATDPGGWDGFTSKMKVIAPGVYEHHFCGGSGIVFRRSKVDKIPETESKILGWRQFQRNHPELKKAFTDHVEIKLLDENGYEDYPEYYKQTERI